MDKKTTLEMIAAISNANGTSGFEDEVVAAIRPYAEGLGEITEDRMRNLYIRRKENNGKRPVVQLDAHSDEVGMVQAICPNGTLRIIQVGGWVNHNIPAMLKSIWLRMCTLIFWTMTEEKMQSFLRKRSTRKRI